MTFLEALLVCRRHSKSLDPVVVGISALCPEILRSFRGIRDSRNGLHIFEAELYRYKQTERRAVVHGKWASVEVGREQGLRMTGCRQIDRHEVRVGISPGTQIDRGVNARPFRLRHWRVRA